MESKKLQCKDCNNGFIFTIGEQEFYQARGYTNPLRCPSCRKLNRKGRTLLGWGVWNPEPGLCVSSFSTVSEDGAIRAFLLYMEAGSWAGYPDARVVRVEIKYAEPGRVK